MEHPVVHVVGGEHRPRARPSPRPSAAAARARAAPVSRLAWTAVGARSALDPVGVDRARARPAGPGSASRSPGPGHPSSGIAGRPASHVSRVTSTRAADAPRVPAASGAWCRSASRAQGLASRVSPGRSAGSTCRGERHRRAAGRPPVPRSTAAARPASCSTRSATSDDGAARRVRDQVEARRPDHGPCLRRPSIVPTPEQQCRPRLRVGAHPGERLVRGVRQHDLAGASRRGARRLVGDVDQLLPGRRRADRRVVVRRDPGAVRPRRRRGASTGTSPSRRTSSVSKPVVRSQASAQRAGRRGRRPRRARRGSRRGRRCRTGAASGSG